MITRDSRGREVKTLVLSYVDGRIEVVQTRSPKRLRLMRREWQGLRSSS